MFVSSVGELYEYKRSRRLCRLHLQVYMGYMIWICTGEWRMA